MHRSGELAVELLCRISACFCGYVQGFAKADRCTTERSWWGLAVAQTNWNDWNLNALTLGELSKTHQPTTHLNWCIGAVNPPFWKHHQLLAATQKSMASRRVVIDGRP